MQEDLGATGVDMSLLPFIISLSRGFATPPILRMTDHQPATVKLLCDIALHNDVAQYGKAVEAVLDKKLQYRAFSTAT